MLYDVYSVGMGEWCDLESGCMDLLFHDAHCTVMWKGNCDFTNDVDDLFRLWNSPKEPLQFLRSLILSSFVFYMFSW